MTGQREGADHEEHRRPHQPRGTRDHPAVARFRTRTHEVDADGDDAEREVHAGRQRSREDAAEVIVFRKIVDL